MASEDPLTREALRAAAEAEPRTIEEQIALCEIPAPPFGEEERARSVRERFSSISSLSDVRIDSEGNVLAHRDGTVGGAPIVLSAHLDTVFPAGTDVRVRREGTRLFAPGICDDCRGLAVLLAVARLLDHLTVSHRRTLLLVATVGEEGAGDLRGVRHLFDNELPDGAAAFVSIDGSGIRLVSEAVGSARYRVRYRGRGGHSFADFGIPNPAHALGRFIAEVAEWEVPDDPPTTFGIGAVQGGTVVNAIPAEASALVDLRSVGSGDLEALVERFREAAERAGARERDGRKGSLELEIESLGSRPAARQRPDLQLLERIRAAAATAGSPVREGPSSTDANYPMSLGTPSATIGGGGRCGGIHTTGEWFDTAGSEAGTQWALLVVLSLIDVESRTAG